MFRLRPKPKVLTVDELACCKVSLGGRTTTEFDTTSGADPIEDFTNNGDGTYKSGWTTLTGSTGFGEIATTLCCSEILHINLGLGSGLGDQVSMTINVVGGDQADEAVYFIGEHEVEVDHPDLVPVGVCGTYLRIAWGGEITVTIIHGAITS